MHARMKSPAMIAAAGTARPIHAAAGRTLPAAAGQHALAFGFTRSIELSAAVAVLALIVLITAIRWRRSAL